MLGLEVATNSTSLLRMLSRLLHGDARQGALIGRQSALLREGMYHAAGDTNARSYIWYEKLRASSQRGNKLLGLAGPRDFSDMTIAALQPGQGHMKQGNIQSSVNEVTHKVRRNSQVHLLVMLEHHSRQGIDNLRALALLSFCSRRCMCLCTSRFLCANIRLLHVTSVPVFAISVLRLVNNSLRCKCRGHM